MNRIPTTQQRKRRHNNWPIQFSLWFSFFSSLYFNPTLNLNTSSRKYNYFSLTQYLRLTDLLTEKPLPLHCYHSLDCLLYFSRSTFLSFHSLRNYVLINQSTNNSLFENLKNLWIIGIDFLKSTCFLQTILMSRLVEISTKFFSIDQFDFIPFTITEVIGRFSIFVKQATHNRKNNNNQSNKQAN